MKKRTTGIAAGSAVVVAAAAVTAVVLFKDDGQPLPKPAVGSAAGYRLDVPAGDGAAGGHFPRDNASVALLPDGGAVFQVAAGSARQVFRLSSSGSLTRLSVADAGKARPVSAAGKALVAADANGVTEYDPASGSITSVPASGLTQFAVPIGAEPDGALLVADSSQEIVWEVKDGTAKQFAKIPATGPSRHCPVSGDGQNCTRSEFDHVVVDGKGVVYVLEKYSVPADVNTTEANHYAPLSTMLTIPSANATPTPVTLPNSISGIQGDPGALRTLAVTAADDGVYALVETPGGDFTAARYVLHIHGGSADVVGAQQRLPGDGTAQCSFKGTVSPTALPCLPDDNTASLAYLDGRLLVAGWLDAPNNSPTARTANVVIGVRG